MHATGYRTVNHHWPPLAGASSPFLLGTGPRGSSTAIRSLVPPQQLRQLGEVSRHTARLVTGEQLGRRAPAGSSSK